MPTAFPEVTIVSPGHGRLLEEAREARERMGPFTFWLYLAMTFPPYVELPLSDARREGLAR